MDSKSISGGLPSSLTVNRDSGIKKNDEADNRTTNRTDRNSKNWSVNLSPESKSIFEARKKALEIAKSTPDVRQEKIDAIKAKIKSGEYKVDAGKVADGMLKEAIRDHLASDPGMSLDEI